MLPGTSHRTLLRGRPRPRTAASIGVLALLLAFVPGARAQDAEQVRETPAERRARIVQIKHIEVAALRDGVMRELAEREAEARERREHIGRERRHHRRELREVRERARRDANGGRSDARSLPRARKPVRDGGASGQVARIARTGRPARRAPGVRARPTPETALASGRSSALPAGVSAATAIPTNVRANNTAGDAANAGQAEESIAALGNKVLVAWNDGQGYVAGNPYTDTQGFATSADNGATFTDGVRPPKPAGFASWVWTSDPVVSVNEKTGKFYYCALANSDATHNAIGLVSGSFVGSSFVWDSARVVRNELNSNYLLDKPWVAADSASGNVYVTMTVFDATTPADWIDFTRSTNGGRTWSAPYQISDWQTDGLVQASRPVIGPGGKLYAAWQAIGDTIQFDYVKFAASPNQGVTFDPEVTAAGYIPNFGTGAPGYNRERGVHFPVVAVDRTTSVNRGRIYLAWPESYDHIDDAFLPLNSSPNKSEVEANNAYNSATPFTPGDVLRGSSSSTGDIDHWKFSLTAGQAIIVWVDSLVLNATYSIRLQAPNPDSLQRLCYAADLISNPSEAARQSYFTFRAPNTGTYYLRFAPATGSSLIGNYRIRTKIGQSASERGRDQRDVFVTHSDNGVDWSTPTRANDARSGYDEYLPEIAVGGDGCPWLTWRDHRLDLYGSRTNEFVTRSVDGGDTWEINQAFTSATGNFTTSQSNLMPNEGDYNGLASDGRYLRAAWADGRGTSVDVWTSAIDTDHAFALCPRDTTTTAGSQVWLKYQLTNFNPLFTNKYKVTVTSQRNWPMPVETLTVRPGSTVTFIPRTTVPDTAKAGRNRICVNVQNARGSKTAQCCQYVTVIPGGVAVESAPPPEFALAPSVPNPAFGHVRIAFTLPARAPVRLCLYGLQGEVVRTLVDGMQPAGTTTLEWDGRDDRGRAVAAGAYFLRLQAPGRSATRRLVWMK